MKRWRRALFVLSLLLMAHFTFAVPIGGASYTFPTNVLGGGGGTDSASTVLNTPHIFRQNGALTAGNCANYLTIGTPVACSVLGRHYVLQAATITSVAGYVTGSGGSQIFTGTEQCDVRVLLNGSPVTSTNLFFGSYTISSGPYNLNNSGEFQIITGLSIAVAQGDLLQVVMDTPGTATWCQTGAGCACSGAGGFGYQIVME